jgi:hypothetical protein
MTPEEYRTLIQESEERITEKLAKDQQRLLCSLQSQNQTFVKNPGLVCYTGEYQRLFDQAQLQMSEDAEAIETRFYDELENGPCM